MNASCPATSPAITPGFRWGAWLVGAMAMLLLCIGSSAQRLDARTLDLDSNPAQEGVVTAIVEVAALPASPQSSQAPGPEPELLARNTDDFDLEASICCSLESEPDKGTRVDDHCKQSQPIGRLNIGSPARQVVHPAWLAPSSRGPPTLA